MNLRDFKAGCCCSLLQQRKRRPAIKLYLLTGDAGTSCDTSLVTRARARALRQAGLASRAQLLSRWASQVELTPLIASSFRTGGGAGETSQHWRIIKLFSRRCPPTTGPRRRFPQVFSSPQTAWIYKSSCATGAPVRPAGLHPCCAGFTLAGYTWTSPCSTSCSRGRRALR